MGSRDPYIRARVPGIGSSAEVRYGRGERPPIPAAGLQQRAREEARRLIRRVRDYRDLHAYNNYVIRHPGRVNGEVVWNDTLKARAGNLEQELRYVLEIARNGVPSWEEIDDLSEGYLARRQVLRSQCEERRRMKEDESQTA